MTAALQEVDELDPFDTPSNDMVKLTDDSRLGHLLLITVDKFYPQMKTTNGEADALDVDFVDLGVPGKNADPVEHVGVRVFSKVLVGTLRRKAGTGKPVLGILGQGSKANGKNAPWLLNSPDDAAKQIARDYIKTHPKEDPFA